LPKKLKDGLVRIFASHKWKSREDMKRRINNNPHAEKRFWTLCGHIRWDNTARLPHRFIKILENANAPSWQIADSLLSFVVPVDAYAEQTGKSIVEKVTMPKRSVHRAAADGIG
jgi:hypothetical protein